MKLAIGMLALTMFVAPVHSQVQIDNTGIVYTKSGNVQYRNALSTQTYSLYIDVLNASTTGQIINGAASATADLVQWQVGGALKGKIDTSGNQILVGSTTVQGNAFSVGVSTFVVNGGQVGVLTATPSYPLHVAGAEYASGQLIVGGTATVQGNAFSVGASTIDVSNGRLGVGMTPQFGVINAFASGGTVDAIVISTYTGSGTNTNWRIRGGQQNTGDFALVNFVGGTNNTRMLIDTSGNIGVGTLIPASLLHVNGGAQFGNTGTSISSFTAAGYLLKPSFAKASIDTLTGVIGAEITCSDCNIPYNICKGTGTAAAQWMAIRTAAISGGSTQNGCGSGQ